MYNYQALITWQNAWKDENEERSDVNHATILPPYYHSMML